MIITVLGASGFLGQHLVNELLRTTDHTVRAFCRSATDLQLSEGSIDRLELIAGDVLNEDDVQLALRGADAAYYLVHMMGNPDGDFYELEDQAAHVVGKVAERVGLGRLIYVSGLGDDNDHLSKHLASRHNTGRILRERLDVVIELRASMIIGEGSVAYDIVRTIAHKLPVLIVPRWSITDTQPITLRDMLAYLVASLDVHANTNQIVEVGGPEALTYAELVVMYACKIGRRERVYAVPGIPHWLAKTWLNMFMPPKHAGIAGPMVDSLSNTMVVTDDSALKLFPHIHPEPIELAFFDD